MNASNLLRKLKDIVQNNSGLAYVSMGFGANTILGGLFWFYIASIIDVKDYGLVSYWIAGSQVITTVGAFGLGVTLTTYIAKGVKEIISPARTVIFVSSVIFGIATHLLFGNLSLDFVVIGTMFYTIATSEMLGMKRFREFGVVNVLQKILQIGISIVLIPKGGIDAILIGFAISYMITSYRFYPVFNSLSFHFNVLLKRKQFILSSFGQEIIRISSLALDKIFIGAIFGYTVLGMYSLAIQLLLVLATVPNIMFAYLLPHDASGNSQKKLKIFGIAVSSLLAVMMALFGPFLLEKLFPRFVDTPEIIRIVSFSIIPMTLSSVINSMILGKEKAQLMIASTIVLLASQFSLLFILGKMFSFTGIAIALLLAYCIEAAIQLVFYKKFIRNDRKSF